MFDNTRGNKSIWVRRSYVEINIKRISLANSMQQTTFDFNVTLESGCSTESDKLDKNKTLLPYIAYPDLISRCNVEISD